MLKRKTAKKLSKAISRGGHSSAVPAGYATFLAGLKARVRSAQLRAAVSINHELILLYWEIGKAIAEAQKTKGYGKQVVERLAEDLQKEFPGVKGFSPQNVWFMRSFFLAWPAITPILSQPVRESEHAKLSQPARESGHAILSQPARESGHAKLSQPVRESEHAKLSQPARESEHPKLSQPVRESEHPILSQPVRELTASGMPDVLSKLPWGHNRLLLTKLDARKERLWYAHKAVECGWSRTILVHQIEHQLHKREGKAVTNFQRTLPPAQSDLAEQTLKDPYNFDFLTLGGDAHERDLELGLFGHIQKFLLELGVGFAFVGRQYHLEISGQDYYIDLLFYHLQLRCYVVIDLKMKSFEPEFAGKMNFYLSAIDDQLRHADDKPSIGLLLCKEHDRLTVEYALRDLRKPIGVAQWQTRLVESLPKNLRGSLPTVEEIEAELGKTKSKATPQIPPKKHRSTPGRN